MPTSENLGSRHSSTPDPNFPLVQTLGATDEGSSHWAPATTEEIWTGSLAADFSPSRRPEQVFGEWTTEWDLFLFLCLSS